MDQKFFYSGYKKVYSVKFQAIMAPDGLIIHLAGCLSIYLLLVYHYFTSFCLFLSFLFLILILISNLQF